MPRESQRVREDPLVLLLSGPSGSGKSTAALAWADSRLQPSAAIDMDVVRHFMRVGRARPDDGWDTEAARQWHCAMVQTAMVARSHLEDGLLCVVDAYAPPSESEEWDRLLSGLDIRKVHLDPSYEECRRRNGHRRGDGRLGEDALRHNFETHPWCLEQRRPTAVIDNTTLSVVETVAEIDRLLIA